MRFLLAILATLSTSIIVAQELPNVAIGAIKSGSEQSLVSEPRSTVVIDIQLSMLRFTAGEYARYAQKYLGERAPLSDKVLSSIEGANISLAPADFLFTKPLASLTKESTISPAQELPADRTSAEILSPEQRAQAAAQRVFANRRLIHDLISGDIGEGVFGAGLSSAIKRLEREERECTALFMGVQKTTQHTRRIAINLRKKTTRYMIGRFDPENGLTSPNNIDGEAVYLQITPSTVKDSTCYIAGGKESFKKVFISPNYSQCDLYVGANIIASTELPLYEFGSRITVTNEKR